MSEGNTIIVNAVEFVDFLKANNSILVNLENFFQPQLQNLQSIRESLNRRPCSCGGVNPDAVIAERRANLENLYKAWIHSLNTEQQKNLQSALGENVTLKLEGEVVLET